MCSTTFWLIRFDFIGTAWCSVSKGPEWLKRACFCVRSWSLEWKWEKGIKRGWQSACTHHLLLKFRKTPTKTVSLYKHQVRIKKLNCRGWFFKKLTHSHCVSFLFSIRPELQWKMTAQNAVTPQTVQDSTKQKEEHKDTFREQRGIFWPQTELRERKQKSPSRFLRSRMENF